MTTGRAKAAIRKSLREEDRGRFVKLGWELARAAFDNVGKKATDKVYYRHTGHPGGIKETSPAKILEGRFPERVLIKAVERMVPRGPLGRAQMRNLRVFKGTEHPHTAQNPEVIDVAAMNRKNSTLSANETADKKAAN